jgi:hypothetical protein
MPKLIDEAPDARSVLNDAELARFSHIVEQRQASKALIKAAEEEIKKLDEDITSILTDVGIPKVQYGDMGVALVQGKRSNLSKERLLELGVAATTIAAATTHTSYTYVLVKAAS